MIDEDKRFLRERAMATRLACDPAWGARLASHFLRGITPIAPVVAGFWPLEGEIDIRPLLQQLAARGHQLALPLTPKRGQPLTFHHWIPGQPLLSGRFGTSHPSGPAVQPGLVLVPLLAFDRHGGRLGYGAGYYDRTLALLAGVARIGCAFALQEVDEVPQGPDDQRLDAVATEAGVIVCRRPENEEK